ncbi:MAG TPA: hypothetical protein VKZ59_06280 [Acidobacteriota bacterium]|nr:hypothetical protein [Acidobacteriota bacterium]
MSTKLSDRTVTAFFSVLVALIASSGMISCTSSDTDFPAEELLRKAKENGVAANQGFRRTHRYLTDWLDKTDARTGLIPRNLNDSRDIWNAPDAAADNYPFMVLTSFFTDRERFEGRLLQMLRTERELTSRLGALPDTYSFSRSTFLEEEPDLDRIIFGASEYVKDGLLPLTEWLGASPWSERMIEIVDDIWKEAPVETPYGRIPSDSHEINGEMLQVLSRVYWMTGDRKYLDWAIRLGDYYLLGDHHPTRDSDRLRLRDHGCEIVSGLTELYATLHFADPDKKQTYRDPIYEMLERLLEVGRNEHGLFYNVINPQTGEIIDDRPADTFGYTYNAFYTVYLIDSEERYRQAVVEALESLSDRYHNFSWEGGSADGDADAIEGALNLYNREPLSSAKEWIDREIQFMWGKQDSSPRDPDGRWRNSGIIEGWHGDGNFARTTLYYCLWKTQGLYVRPWREDVVLGAATDLADRFIVVLSAGKDWAGKLFFDAPRHTHQMKLPIDWPRINQFPEWFTVQPNESYTVQHASGEKTDYSGKDLLEGLDLNLTSDHEVQLIVTVASAAP